MQSAKRQVYGTVDIDMIAGPSEVAIVADETCDPSWIAADLLAQAEHDEMAGVWLICWSKGVAAAVFDEVETQLELLDRKAIARLAVVNRGITFIVRDEEDAIELVNHIAPEHVEVLMAKGWIKNEHELSQNPLAHTQPLPAYFGLSMMFPHIHPLARAAQHYFVEAIACLGISAYLSLVDDPLVRHEHLSQRDEELMHFMEGKYKIDTYCTTPQNQKPVEDTLDFLLHRLRVSL